MGVIYQRPNSDIHGFNKLLEIPEIIRITQTPCYLLGYININLSNYNVNQNIQKYADMLYNHSFCSYINMPTRITHQSAILIDHIWCCNFNASIKSEILVTDFTICHLFKEKKNISNYK